MNHNMLSPREAEVDGFLNGLGDLLKSVLMTTKVCMSKSEEELQGSIISTNDMCQILLEYFCNIICFIQLC